MPDQHLSVNPNIEHLKNQAKKLLQSYRSGEDDAVSAFRKHYPGGPSSDDAQLTDAQLVTARLHGFKSWARLQRSVQLMKAIYDDKPQDVRDFITAHPEMLHEVVRNESWGPPMSTAANLGRSDIVALLAEMGAADLDRALGRAMLHDNPATIQRLLDLGAKFAEGAAMGPCESLNGKGLKLLSDFGVEMVDAHGNYSAPHALVLETYARNPEGKHLCLEVLESHGVTLPDTPVMALHRGRIDQLEAHLARDPELPHRHFGYDDIYLKAFRVADDTGLHGTPLDGTTLLHIAVEFHEAEICDWLLAHGADPNARALVDGDGFGGHTPLFNAMVAFRGPEHEAPTITRRLLDHGADPNVRASLRKVLKDGDEETVHTFRDVTPVEYAAQFPDDYLVNEAAAAAIQTAMEK